MRPVRTPKIETRKTRRPVRTPKRARSCFLPQPHPIHCWPKYHRAGSLLKNQNDINEKMFNYHFSMLNARIFPGQFLEWFWSSFVFVIRQKCHSIPVTFIPYYIYDGRPPKKLLVTRRGLCSKAYSGWIDLQLTSWTFSASLSKSVCSVNPVNNSRISDSIDGAWSVFSLKCLMWGWTFLFISL